MSPRARRLVVRPRIRVMLGDDVVVGPGKADLLEAIERAGSIRGAARELEMSYMRAWSLVRAMNAAFRGELVTSARGGKGRGGATLTEKGRQVLELYREMQRNAGRAVEALAAKLEKLL